MRDSNHRKLRFESLEDRRMLATGLGEGAANPTLELVHGPTGTIPYCASSVCNVSLTATVKSNATSSDYNLVADWYANAISASGGTVGVTFDVDEFHHDLSGSLEPQRGDAVYQRRHFLRRHRREAGGLRPDLHRLDGRFHA